MQDDKEFEKIAAFLKKNPVFSQLDDQQLEFIVSHLAIRSCAPGENAIAEGDVSHDIQLIYKGKAAILKWDAEKAHQFKIKDLYAGEAFGEMAFFDDQPRSATIKITEAAVLLSLSRDLFDGADTFTQAIYDQIASNIAHINIPRLRSSNEQYIATLKSEMNHLLLRTRFGTFFITVIVILGIGGLFDLFAQAHPEALRSLWYNWAYTISLLTPTLIAARYFDFNLHDAGVTLKNWKKALLDGVVTGGIVMLVMYFSKDSLALLLLKFNIVKAPEPLTLFTTLYIANAYLQELMTRGIAQTILQRFFDDPRGIRTVFITSLVFFIFHLHIGLVTALAALVASILFGLVYIRSYNLIGVTLFHSAVGIAGMWTGLL